VNSLTDTAALQAATVLWWLFVGTLSLAALAIIGVNLRLWRGERGRRTVWRFDPLRGVCVFHWGVAACRTQLVGLVSGAYAGCRRPVLMVSMPVRSLSAGIRPLYEAFVWFCVAF
jgi:hypothetical protein